MNASLFGWIAGGELRDRPARAVLSVLAIATGVALGFAVHLINTSALNEFSSAIRSVNGNADLQVRAVRENGFDEGLYARLAALDEVAMASPVLEVDVALRGAAESLKILGIDVLRAATVTPTLVGMPEQAAAGNGGSQSTTGEAAGDAAADATVGATVLEPARLFDPDAIWLTDSALTTLGKRIGEPLEVLVGDRSIRLRIAGTLPGAPAGLRLGTMDIAGAQWRLQRLGQLSRVDLKLAAGVDAQRFAERLRSLLPTDAQVLSEPDALSRTDSLSRAYRVNLDMLALMALFTGAFLVYATQSLSVARRANQLALLRVLGNTRRALLAEVLLEGALLGVIGAALGLVLGLLLARVGLSLLGGDLGGGYFQGSTPELVWAFEPALVFFLLGVLAALFGSGLPARRAAQAQPAVALKSGDEGFDPRVTPRIVPAAVLLSSGTVSALLPPLDGLPVFGYAAMALLLFGGIAAMPWIARVLLRGLDQMAASAPLQVSLDLAIKRLWGAPAQATVALSGIVASVSLMVAMALMITSFRQSVDDWLTQILPADVYLRVAAAGASTGFDAQTQARLRALPGIANIDFQKNMPLRLAPDLPPVDLIARHLDTRDPQRSLPLLQQVDRLAADLIPVWGSEAMRDLYGWKTGQRVSLPLGDGKSGAAHFQVAGIWRDYARQHGAIAMRNADYDRLTGDTVRSDAAIMLAAGTSPETLARKVRAALPAALAEKVQFTEPAAIRALSLRIFDRSFAVTHLLQAVAIAIGLLGVAATFSAQTLARAREFGMLRHIGVLRRQVVAMLAWEGALLGAVGVTAGLLLGFAMSQVLIHVINPQSFHWTMETHVPWGLLGAVSATLLLTTAGTAVLAGRQALSRDALRAVREDW